MSKIQSAYNGSGRELSDSEKIIVDAFSDKYQPMIESVPDESCVERAADLILGTDNKTELGLETTLVYYKNVLNDLRDDDSIEAKICRSVIKKAKDQLKENLAQK